MDFHFASAWEAIADTVEHQKRTVIHTAQHNSHGAIGFTGQDAVDG